jgi:hypothetical protein
MLFKSSLLAQASGSVGGSTYSHNRAGMYIRNRTMPVNPATPLQQLVRSYFSQLSPAWGATLSAVQRAAWEVYAANVTMINKLGDPINLTGQQHFLRTNLLRLQAALSPVLPGPTTFTVATPGSPSTYAATASSHQLAVTFDNTALWAGAVGGAMLIWMGSPQSPSTNFFAGPYRYVGKIAGAATPPTSPSSFTALPFAITATQKVFVVARYLNADGRTSGPFRDLCIVG